MRTYLAQRKFRTVPFSFFLLFLVCSSSIPCQAADSNTSDQIGEASEKALKTGSPPPLITPESRSLAAQAEKAFASRNLGEAGTLYKKALGLSPSSPPLLVSLAAIETRMGKLDDSEKLLHQALTLDLQNAPAWLLLGMNCLEQKRDPEAFAALVQATLYDDRNPRAHNYLGIAAGRKGWNDASEQELRRAIELDPNYADANFNLAVLYLRRTPPLLELAHRHYQQALDLGAQKDPLIEAQLTNGVASPTSAPAPSPALP